MAGSMDWLRYANRGATRNQPINPHLASALEFLPEMGVTAEVFSGGQPRKGSGLARVGSTRHDDGNAADMRFYKDGRQLDWGNPDDRPAFEEIVRRGKAAGITGFGAGPGYMAPGTMHVGYGAPGVWGEGGKAANAPDWLREAYGAGGAPDASSARPMPSFDSLSGGGAASAMAPQPKKAGAAAAIDNIAPTGGSPSGGDMAGRNYRAEALETTNGGRRLVRGPSTQAAGPVLEIGKMQSTELEDALIARQLANSGNIDSPWEAIGGLAQLWAAKSVKDQKTQENAAAFASALNGGGFDPDVAALAKLGGDQDALVQAVTLQSQRRMQAEDRAWRQDERTYQRGRDGVEDQRFQQRRDWQLQDRQSERDNAVSDYRTKAEIDREFTAPPSGYRRTDAGGLEPIPGGPNDRAANFKPDISSVYDEQGREQKGYFDAAGNWTTIGGAKAPSNANGMSVTMPDGTVVQTGGSKPFTEGQSKDNVFSTRARGALPTLNEKAGNLTRYGQKMMDGDPTGIVRGSFQDPEYQVARTSADEFLQAILRKDTGAAITAPEQELYGKTYLPQPGDTKEVMTYKEGARERAIAAIEAGMSPSQMVAQERALAAAAAKKPDAGKTDYRSKYGLE